VDEAAQLILTHFLRPSDRLPAAYLGGHSQALLRFWVGQRMIHRSSTGDFGVTGYTRRTTVANLAKKLLKGQLVPQVKTP
jgi:hypothetical protein